jgi:hypothetical protein
VQARSRSEMNCYKERKMNGIRERLVGSAFGTLIICENKFILPHMDHYLHLPCMFQITFTVLKLSSKWNWCINLTYFAYFNSIMSYGIIFWGNSSYAIKIFKLQKRIITGVKNRDSCRELFKNLKILTLVSQYIVSVVSFIIDNREEYICNYSIHKRNTRQGSNLHQSTVSLSLCQKGIIKMGIKIYDNLPSFIKESYYATRIQVSYKKFSLFKYFLYIR